MVAPKERLKSARHESAGCHGGATRSPEGTDEFSPTELCEKPFGTTTAFKTPDRVQKLGVNSTVPSGLLITLAPHPALSCRASLSRPFWADAANKLGLTHFFPKEACRKKGSEAVFAASHSNRPVPPAKRASAPLFRGPSHPPAHGDTPMGRGSQGRGHLWRDQACLNRPLLCPLPHP